MGGASHTALEARNRPRRGRAAATDLGKGADAKQLAAPRVEVSSGSGTFPLRGRRPIVYARRVSVEPLPLQAYAEALAHVVSRRNQPLESVIGSLGLSVDLFQRADAYWNERLREAHRLRKGVLAMRFAAAFAGARHRIGLSDAAGVTADAPARAAGSEVPSYLKPSPPPAPSAAPAPAPPAASPPQPPPAAPPLAAPAPPVPAAALPSPPAAAAPRGGVPIETIGLPGRQAAPAQPLPFQPGTAPSPLASAAPKPPPPPSPGTGTALVSDEPAARPGTPWDARAAERAPGARINLANFAALNVELTGNPPDREAVLRRYGLQGPDDYRYVEAAYAAQMQVDPDMRSQYEALIARMRSFAR